jgi:hypothetical protein
MRASGMGDYKIVGELNKQEILPPILYYAGIHGRKEPSNLRTKLWEKTTVNNILKNEVYVGNTVQFKRKTASCRDKKIVKRDENEWIKVSNTHEPIVSRELWETVQGIIESGKSKSKNRRKAEQSLFSKLLVCPDCGGSFQHNFQKQTRQNGESVTYNSYCCKTYDCSGGVKCTRHSISERVLIQIVLADIQLNAKRVSLDENKMIETLKSRLITDTKKRNTAKKKRELEQKLHSFEVHTSKLYEDRCDGLITDERFVEMIADLEIKRKTVEEKLTTLNQSQNEKTAKLADIGAWVALIKQHSQIEVLDRPTLEALIDKIEIGEREVINGEKQQDIRIFYKFVGLAN